MSQIPIGWLMKIEGVFTSEKQQVSMMIGGINMDSPAPGPNLFLPKGHQIAWLGV